MADSNWYSFGRDVIGPLVYGAVAWGVATWQSRKNERQRNRPHTPVVQSHHTDLIVRDLLTECRVVLCAMRVAWGKFSNGDKFLDGSDIIKSSWTHESAESWASYRQKNWEGILNSAVPEMMEMVLEVGPSFRTVEELPQGAFKWKCVEDGAKAVAVAGIVRRGNPVFYLVAQFSEKDKPEHIERICEFAGRIAAVFEEAARGADVSYANRGPGQYFRWLLPERFHAEPHKRAPGDPDCHPRDSGVRRSRLVGLGAGLRLGLRGNRRRAADYSGGADPRKAVTV